MSGANDLSAKLSALPQGAQQMIQSTIEDIHESDEILDKKTPLDLFGTDKDDKPPPSNRSRIPSLPTFPLHKPPNNETKASSSSGPSDGKMKEYFLKESKKAGISPKPEHWDVFYQKLKSSPLTNSTELVDFYILGLETERRYGVLVNVSDLTTKLEGVMSNVVQLQTTLKEEVAKERSSITTEIRRLDANWTDMLKQVKVNKHEGESDEEEDDWAPAMRKNVVKKIFLTNKSPPVKLKELDIVDISRMAPIKVTPNEVYEKAAISLGWTSKLAEQKGFREAYNYLEPSEKILVFYNLMEDDLRKHLAEKIVTLAQKK